MDRLERVCFGPGVVMDTLVVFQHCTEIIGEFDAEF